MNKTRILFWGIQRSGNHAIINWILAQYQEPKMFLNHQNFGGELLASPYHSLATLGVDHSTSPKVFYLHKDQGNWQQIWNNPDSGLNELLLISFENYDLNLLTEETYQAGCQMIDESVVGKSLDTLNVMILRDPFNQWMSNLPVTNQPQDPDLWKTYAKEYLGETNFLPNKICINFNRWFIDRSYRKSLSEQLRVPFSDDGLNKVSQAGGGSNFDGTKFDGNAQQMNVLARWEESKNFSKKRRLFKALRQDLEMKRLVQAIYPDLEQKWNRVTWNNFWYYYI